MKPQTGAEIMKKQTRTGKNAPEQGSIAEVNHFQRLRDAADASLRMTRCGDCQKETPQDDLAKSLYECDSIEDRLDAGSEVPAGECECGAFAYLIPADPPPSGMVKCLAGAGEHAEPVLIERATLERLGLAPERAKSGDYWFPDGKLVRDANRLTVGEFSSVADAATAAKAPEQRDALRLCLRAMEKGRPSNATKSAMAAWERAVAAASQALTPDDGAL